MVSVTSASRNITSAPCYRPPYQSRSLIYIRGMILRNFAELAEAVPIEVANVQSMKSEAAVTVRKNQFAAFHLVL